MTKPKPLPEIVRCTCGRKAEIQQSVDGEWWRVSCSSEQWCWSGKGTKTARGAILAWNRVMDQHASHVAARLTLCYRLIRANRRGGIDAVLNEVDKELKK